MLNIALFGPPGAGKGTQSTRLLQRYGLHYVSTGEILREEMRAGTELGNAAREVVARGGLVDDEIIVQILEKTIRENTKANGFLFDGFPRTWVQAYILDGLLLKMHTSLMNLISLEVPREVCMGRLTGRSGVSGRIDDTRDVIETRLREYVEKTAPVLGFYDERGIRVGVDGLGSVDEVFGRITDVVDRSLQGVQLNVVVLGGPGAGRSTQAKLLAEQFDLCYISTGDLLHDEVRSGSPAGRLIQERMDAGDLVPDEIVIRLVEGYIRAHPDKKGLIFKGFPRTLVQAYILDGLLRKIGSSVSCIIELRVPTLELVSRLAARGRKYDLSTDTIVHRLQEHEKYAAAISEYYEKTGRLTVLDGQGSVEKIAGIMHDQLTEAFRRAR
jgi:adenylate kinase